MRQIFFILFFSFVFCISGCGTTQAIKISNVEAVYIYSEYKYSVAVMDEKTKLVTFHVFYSNYRPVKIICDVPAGYPMWVLVQQESMFGRENGYTNLSAEIHIHSIKDARGIRIGDR